MSNKYTLGVNLKFLNGFVAFRLRKNILTLYIMKYRTIITYELFLNNRISILF